MATFRITFIGPPTMVLEIATRLADADGVDLTSSNPPTIHDAETVELTLVVEGTSDDVGGALAAIREELPPGASIESADG